VAYVEPDPPTPTSFEGHFERDGETWLYRRTLRAPAIRITGAERRIMIETQARWQDRFLMILLVGGMAAVTLPLLWIQRTLPWRFWIVGAVAVAAIIMVDHRRLSARSAALFAGRPEAAPARSRREVDRLILTQMSWGSLAINALLPILYIGIYVEQAHRRPLIAGVVLAFWGLIFALSVERAIRKLLLRRSPPA
jgi:hypothetical protein